MSEIRFCGVLILVITFLLIVRFSLRKESSFSEYRAKLHVITGKYFLLWPSRNFCDRHQLALALV